MILEILIVSSLELLDNRQMTIRNFNYINFILEKYSGVVNDSLQSKLDQDDPKLWSNFNISVNFNLMIVLVGLSILFINFVIIGVVVLICR